MKIKFFLPDWEDRLDPDYDFLNDVYSNGHKRNPYANDIYAHQIFNPPPYDGILFSLGVFKSKLSFGSIERPNIKGFINIKDYLKIKEGIEVMGDCGAFTYAYEKNPPAFYSIENVSILYDSLGFDYGVSVDHLVLNYILKRENGKKSKIMLSKREKNRRVKLTVKNAKEFLTHHRKNKFSFTPIGVAQGYDLKTYKKSVIELVEAGYEYVALGSLVHHKTAFIIKILEEIEPHTSNVKIHLFGVLRPDAIDRFKELGVSSFDSASYLRKAWLRSGKNYLSFDNQWYAAIRVPYSDDPRVLKNGETNGYSHKEIKKMEKIALKLLFEYDKGKAKIDDVIEAVMDYDRLLLRNSENIDNLEEKYRRTLSEKPWKHCTCDVCKEIGINVVIFRGTNRNKRRGFHNVWIFNNTILKKND